MTLKSCPQVCIQCRQHKAPQLGRFFRCRHQYASWRWICSACDNQKVPKQVPRPSSPPERQVKAKLVELGLDAIAEFRLQCYSYDFALPRLRMLVEVDSARWHQSLRQQRRDAKKTKLAQANGWHLVRFKVDSHLPLKVELAVNQRAHELGMA